MSFRIALAVISLIVAAMAMFSSSLLQMSMVDAINQKRPPGERVSPYWWPFAKTIQVHHQYRADYPEGRLHLYMWITAGTGLVGLLGFAICFGIIGPGLRP